MIWHITQFNFKCGFHFLNFTFNALGFETTKSKFVCMNLFISDPFVRPSRAVWTWTGSVSSTNESAWIPMVTGPWSRVGLNSPQLIEWIMISLEGFLGRSRGCGPSPIVNSLVKPTTHFLSPRFLKVDLHKVFPTTTYPKKPQQFYTHKILLPLWGARGYYICSPVESDNLARFHSPSKNGHGQNISTGILIFTINWCMRGSCNVVI